MQGNRRMTLRSVAMVVLLAPFGVTAVAMTPKKVETCGGLRIVTAGSEFETAFDVVYRIETDGQFCAADELYDPDIPLVARIELKSATQAIAPTESFPVPLLFRTAHLRRNGTLGQPSLLGFGGSVGTVPAGDYVLVVRYALARCNKRVFANACVASSPVFHLQSPTGYVEER